MQLPTPAVSYRDFRLKKINQPEYRHLWWLIFWPVYFSRYFLMRQFALNRDFTPIHCPLDDKIPFLEGFVIFYGIWFALIIAMHLYTMFYDLDAFRSYSKFLVIAMSISTVTYFVFPNCQNLRPDVYPRDNFLTNCVKFIHAFDPNVNVFPSEHCIGALAVLAAAINCKRLRTPLRLTIIATICILICMSTVFIKQHSILDFFGALLVCTVVYWIVYRKRERI